MTPETLIAYGEAIFGSRWQTELARKLRVSDRTMRRWKAGKHEIPENVATEIVALATIKAGKLISLPSS